ncbi:MAG: TonB-dependent receptor [Candidatus Omnitrophota bacterium]|nr:TonB-dependent receptor [Candidatus Omnitrophota bacterium]
MWAQEPNRLEEVVVTATRTRLPKSKVTKSVSVVSAEQIERQHVQTALEVLRNVPGVFVRRSGAVGRTTSTVIRGSTDDQVVVLLDGVEVSSPTLGNFNWSTLPADSIERIEVLRGSASTLYGSKAIGGVINILTKRGESPMRTSYQQEFGTLRTFREVITNQAAFGPVHYHVGLSRFDSNGLSVGDDVEVTHVAAAGGVQLAEWLTWDVALNNNDSHVGIDDGAFLPDPNRFSEREHLALSTTLNATPLERWEQELRFTFNDDDTLEIDVGNPGTTQATTKSRFNTDRYGMDWLNRFGLDRWGLLTAGFELKDEEAESTGFDKTVFQWAWFLQHQLDVSDRLTLIGGVRNLRHNFFGHETTSEVSASYRVPVTGTRLRVSFSQGFRAPDLNDLFFPNFGNPNLEPEDSESYEVGIGQDWWHGRLGGELTVFRTEVDQLIQAVRVSSTVTEAQNINETEMEGFEVEAHLEPAAGLRILAHWTYTDAEEEPSKEELVRIPKHQVGFNLDYEFLTRWRLNLDATLVDHREESRATNKRERTKGYATVDAALTVQATDRLQLYGRIENLFDRHYSEVLGFPAPGTLFFIGGKVEI